ncbi:MAG: hypothetical protein Q4P33_08290 [Flaviflexus sp.]|nr:hypothetical protein [Flaviflexus sp.]
MSSPRRPRRPAQIDPEQVEYLTGEPDPAFSSELAHASAQALLPTGDRQAVEPEVRTRILALVAEEGVDGIAESWVRAPADTLPGALWRGYLLREWIRREPEEVARRYGAAVKIAEAAEVDGRPTSPAQIKQGWDRVLAGKGHENFAGLLRDSAEFADVIGGLEAVWIASDRHELATEVTRRDEALLATARELAVAAKGYAEGVLD